MTVLSEDFKPVKVQKEPLTYKCKLAITQPIYKGIKALADKDGVSFNKEVNQILLKAIKSEDVNGGGE